MWAKNIQAFILQNGVQGSVFQMMGHRGNCRIATLHRLTWSPGDSSSVYHEVKSHVESTRE